MSEPKVVFEAAPSRWVIEYQNPGQDWAFFERKPTLEAAKEYAQQSMDYASADSAALWRVVDTQPEEPHIPDEEVTPVEEVNHPDHYNGFSNNAEVIDISEHLSFNLGNVIKYVARAGRKVEVEASTDLRKAHWYLTRECQRLGVELNG